MSEEEDPNRVAWVLVACNQCDVIMSRGLAMAEDVAEDFNALRDHKLFECEARTVLDG